MNKQSYIVLARKYRPKDFSTFVGQEALVKTLENAFKFNRIAHAFLLTGTRGIGKTTTARIIARCLNCTGNGRTTPAINPCGECDNCLAIATDSHPDVIEIDAASRTGIDDIREIIEQLQYAAAMGRYKIYIIDEVHMLSNNAFNALLKTIEEPPANTKFIFATTEIKKVPITVISRCQRFDLARASDIDLEANLQNICQQEGINHEEGALKLVAFAAGGSVRDSLSLLDRIILYSSNSETGITKQSVREALGYLDEESTLNLIELILNGEATAALDLMQEFLSHGKPAITILNEVISNISIISNLKISSKAVNIDLYSESYQKRLFTTIEKISIPNIMRLWQIASRSLEETSIINNHDIVLSMFIIKATHTSTLKTPLELLKTLEQFDGSKILSNLSNPPSTVASINLPQLAGGSATGKTAQAPSPHPSELFNQAGFSDSETKEI